MRPGTYVPTHPLEIHAFAMERLRNKWTDLSKQLASFEEQYHKFGLNYHSIPITYREYMVSLPLRDSTIAAFVVSNDASPDVIDSFHFCRAYRDRAKRALYLTNIETAEKELNEWDEIQDDLATQLEAVSNDIRELMDGFSDVDEEDNEIYAARAVEMRKAWILALPEVLKAFKLGVIETEEQAVGMMLAPYESIVDLAFLGPVEDLYDGEEDGPGFPV